jgi:hypothetical protein
MSQAEANLRNDFFNAPDLATAQAKFNERFGVQTAGGAQWTRKGLRRAWRVLERLSENHTHDNAQLARFQRKPGFLDPESSFHHGTVQIHYFHNSLMWLREFVNASYGDVLFWTNRFKAVVLHEVGHALDAKLGYSHDFNPADWKEHELSEISHAFAQEYCTDMNEGFAAETVLNKMFGRNGNTPKTSAEARAWLDDLIAVRPPDPDVRAALRTLGILDASNQEVAAGKRRFLDGDLMKAIIAGSNRPWARDDGGSGVGLLINGRLYQHVDDALDGHWCSYDYGDRQFRVSKYAYRAPGEWFAEHYSAFFYDEDTRARLQALDPYVYDFFDNFVRIGFKPQVPLPGPRPPNYDSDADYYDTFMKRN